MKRTAILIFGLLLAGALHAQTYGRMDFSLQNAQGQAISGAQVNVYTQSACGAAAGVLATLYPTASGGTPLTQPLITDGFGHQFAYTLPGCVTITYNSPYTGLLTYKDQSIFAGNLIGYISGVTATPQTMVGPLNGIWPSSAFGVQCNGSTDDSAALNSIGTFAATLAAGRTLTVSFPSNSVCTYATTISTWLVTNLHIIGNGTRLKFTGTGHAIHLTDSSQVDNNDIEGFVLQGNSGADYGLYNDAIAARGTLDFINIQDFTQACANLADIQLYNKVNISCSDQMASMMGVAQTTTPVNGVILGLTPSTGVFANNRQTILQIEGTGTGIGVWCKDCNNGNVFYGTSEGGAGIGLQMEAYSGDNALIGFDLEANGSKDIVEKGHGNVYIDVSAADESDIVSATNLEFIGSGFGTIVDVGGASQNIKTRSCYFQTITLNGNAGQWSFEDPASGATGFTLHGPAYPFLVEGLLYKYAGIGDPSAPGLSSTGDLAILANTGSAKIADGENGNIGVKRWWQASGTNWGFEWWGGTSGAPTVQMYLDHNGLNNANGTVLPATLTGFHGTAGTKVQLGDGTGTSGPAFFAADGSMTSTPSYGKLLANCGTLTTTAAASDALSCAWVTTSSNCAVTPNNSTTVVWTYYLPTAGTVTVYHAATASATYAIACSVN